MFRHFACSATSQSLLWSLPLVLGACSEPSSDTPNPMLDTTSTLSSSAGSSGPPVASSTAPTLSSALPTLSTPPTTPRPTGSPSASSTGTSTASSTTPSSTATPSGTLTGAGGASAGGSAGAGAAGAGGVRSAGDAGAFGGTESLAGAGGQGNEGGAGGEFASAGAPAGGSAGTSGQDPEAFNPCPASDDPCAVLPLGDSITEGFGSSGGGYRVQLFRRAVLDDKSLTFTGNQMNGPSNGDIEGQQFPRRHEGRGGFTIDGISDVTDDAMAQQTPHIVLLMIGTNDLNGNIDVAAAPTRLGNLIDQITDNAPDALVVVATIIPIENGNGPKVPTYNSAIAELVQERVAQGQHVIAIDNNAAFTANGNYASEWMGDTLHPNDAGYEVLGDAFYEAIQAYLPAL